MSAARALRAGLAAAATTRLVRDAAARLSRARPVTDGGTRAGTTGSGTAAGPDPRWERTNHRGATVSLLEGPAVAAGLVVGGLAAGDRAGAAQAVACAGAAAFGLVDDLSEDLGHRRKGLRGHLGALAHGELTTGGLKVLGIGVSSVAAAALLHRDGSVPARAADALVSGALVAGCANLVNLLDLRPGRALKSALLAALPLLDGRGGAPAAAVVGTAAVALPADLAERDMLGDGGANAAGAAVGVALAAAAPRFVRLAALAGVVGLTVASERVSFTAVIARTPVLRELDAWGRR